jgi:very-long-chain enoyl-CoA reductase
MFQDTYIDDILEEYKTPIPSICPVRDNIRVTYDNGTYFFNKDGFEKVIKHLVPPRYNWKEVTSNEWVVKDYGLQISWRTVYIIEYLGALLIYPLIMKDNLFRMDVIMWLLHYSKRLLESIFIHSFSSETMPFTNVIKNSVYYWGAGAVISYYGTKIDNIQFVLNQQNQIIFGLWVVCQYINGYCHYYLANLRKSVDDTNKDTNTVVKHVIPTNILFRYACCPNYGFEVLGWFLFTMYGNANIEYTMTQIFTMYNIAKFIFCMIGLSQMYVWSKGKYRRYKKLYDDKYKVKKLLIPLII